MATFKKQKNILDLWESQPWAKPPNLIRYFKNNYRYLLTLLRITAYKSRKKSPYLPSKSTINLCLKSEVFLWKDCSICPFWATSDLLLTIVRLMISNSIEYWSKNPFASKNTPTIKKHLIVWPLQLAVKISCLERTIYFFFPSPSSIPKHTQSNSSRHWDLGFVVKLFNGKGKGNSYENWAKLLHIP